MKIAMVGLGVIGGSFAMALKKAGYDEVYGIDIDESTITKAKSIGIIKDGCTKGNEILKEADQIIMLKDGAVVGSGVYDDLSKDNLEFKNMLKMGEKY